VEINHGKTTADCFVSYTNEKEEYSHKCYIYGNFQLGKPKFKKEKALLWDKAPQVKGFIGYQDLRQKLISQFFASTAENRLVRVTGPPGIGKSALARHTVNYVQDRGFIDGGCIYIDCR
jgi:hypothetical protein